MKKIKYIFFLTLCSLLPMKGAFADASSKINDSVLLSTFYRYIAANKSSGCWFCGLFARAYEAMNKVCTNLFYKLQTPILSILGIGLALWLLFTVMKFLTQFQGGDVAEFISKLSRGLFKGVVAVALLEAGSGGVYRYIVSPIFDSGAIFAQQILSVDDYRHSISASGEVGEQINNILSRDPCESTSSIDLTKGLQSGAVPVFNLRSFRHMDCMLRVASQRVMFGMALGATLMRLSLQDSLWDVISHLFDFFDVFFYGLCVLIGHFAVLIILPLKFIDILMRITFVGALMPLFIVAWVFPATSGYAKKAFNILVGAVFTMLTLSILTVLSLNIMTFALPLDERIVGMSKEENRAFLGFKDKGGVEYSSLIDFLAEDPSIENIQERFNFSAWTIFFTIIACFFAFKIIGLAADITNSLTEFKGAPNKLGSAIGAKGVQVTQTVATVATAAVVAGGGLASQAHQLHKVRRLHKRAHSDEENNGA